DAAPSGGSFALPPEPAPAKNLPDETQIKVFTLRNSKAADAARIINQLFGRELHSVAVDERTNSIIVRGSAGEVLNVIYHIITRLDEVEESGKTPQAAIASRENSSSSVPIADLKARDDALEKSAAAVAKQIRELNAAPE